MPPSRPDNDYFLTRHHANLLEALDRATREPGSLALIHGEAGLGKSRLLQAFLLYRCSERRWRRIECLSQGLFRLSDAHGEQAPRPQHELAEALEASDDDLWLVDGFELALDHGRKPLFEAWRAAQPRPALVLVGSLEWPDQWRERLPEQDGPILEASIQPLTVRESEAFLCNRLCPLPGQRLRMDPALRRALRQARGRPRRLLELADSQESECQELSLTSTAGWPRVFALVLLAAGVALLGRYSLFAGSQSDAVELPPQQQPVTAAVPVEQQATESPIMPQAVVREPAVPPSEPLEPSRDDAVDEEATAAAAREAPVVAARSPAETKSSNRYAGQPLLQQRLQATRGWLHNGDGGLYSIQLMTLGGEDSAASLQRYLEKLQGQGVNPDRLWVYRARSERWPQGYFGLLYGRYGTRDQAIAALRELPPALRVKQPLIRSLEGLRRETGIP